MLGLWTALWADAGMVGPSTVLEGGRGVAQAVVDAAGPVPAPRFEPEGWAITRVTFKPYPCNRACHAVLTALDELGPIDAAAVQRVDVWTYPYAVELDRRSEGWSAIAAQLSIRKTVALALTWGGLEPESAYGAARLADPRVARLAERTTVAVDPALDAAGPRVRRARVRATLDGGGAREAEADARWGPSRGASDRELRERFLRFSRLGGGVPAFDPWDAPETTRVRHLLEGVGRG